MIHFDPSGQIQQVTQQSDQNSGWVSTGAVSSQQIHQIYQIHQIQLIQQIQQGSSQQQAPAAGQRQYAMRGR